MEKLILKLIDFFLLQLAHCLLFGIGANYLFSTPLLEMSGKKGDFGNFSLLPIAWLGRRRSGCLCPLGCHWSSFSCGLGNQGSLVKGHARTSWEEGKGPIVVGWLLRGPVLGRLIEGGEVRSVKTDEKSIPEQTQWVSTQSLALEKLSFSTVFSITSFQKGDGRMFWRRRGEDLEILGIRIVVKQD